MISFSSKEIDFINSNISSCSEIVWETITEKITHYQEKHHYSSPTTYDKDKSHSNKELLFSLNFYNNSLTNIIGLPPLYFIFELNLSSNSLRSCDLPELIHLSSLQKLNLSANQLSSIDLPYLPKLKSLKIAYNFISNLSGIHLRIPNIEELDIRSNQLSKSSDLDDIEYLLQLRYLFLLQNNVNEKLQNLYRLFSICECLQSIDEKKKEEFDEKLFSSSIATPKIDSLIKRKRNSSHNSSVGERMKETESTGISSPLSHLTSYYLESNNKSGRKEDALTSFLTENQFVSASKVLFPTTNKSSPYSSSLTTTRRVSPATTSKIPKANPWKENSQKMKIRRSRSPPSTVVRPSTTSHKNVPSSSRRFNSDPYDISIEEKSLYDHYNPSNSKKKNKKIHASPEEENEEEEEDAEEGSENEEREERTHQLSPLFLLENMFSLLEKQKALSSTQQLIHSFYHWKAINSLWKHQQEISLLQSLLTEKEKTLHSIEENEMKNKNEISKKVLQEKTKNSQLHSRILSQEKIISELKNEKETIIKRISSEAEREKEKEELLEKERMVFQKELKEKEEALKNVEENTMKLQENYENAQKEILIKDSMIQQQQGVLQEKEKIILKLETDLETTRKNHLLSLATSSSDDSLDEARQKEKKKKGNNNKEKEKEKDLLLIESLQKEIKELKKSFSLFSENSLKNEKESFEKEKEWLRQVTTLNKEKQENVEKCQQLEQSSQSDKKQLIKLENRLLTLQQAFDELSRSNEVNNQEKEENLRKLEKADKTIKGLTTIIHKLEEINIELKERKETKEKEDRTKEELENAKKQESEKVSLLQEKILTYEQLLQTLKNEKQLLFLENSSFKEKEKEIEKERKETLQHTVKTLEKYKQDLQNYDAKLQDREEKIHELQEKYSYSKQKYEILLNTIQVKNLELENLLKSQQKEIEKKEKELNKCKEAGKAMKQLLQSYLVEQQKQQFQKSFFSSTTATATPSAHPEEQGQTPAQQRQDGHQEEGFDQLLRNIDQMIISSPELSFDFPASSSSSTYHYQNSPPPPPPPLPSSSSGRSQPSSFLESSWNDLGHQQGMFPSSPIKQSSTSNTTNSGSTMAVCNAFSCRKKYSDLLQQYQDLQQKHVSLQEEYEQFQKTKEDEIKILLNDLVISQFFSLFFLLSFSFFFLCRES
jgi:hypothetical protein